MTRSVSFLDSMIIFQREERPAPCWVQEGWCWLVMRRPGAPASRGWCRRCGGPDRHAWG